MLLFFRYLIGKDFFKLNDNVFEDLTNRQLGIYFNTVAIVGNVMTVSQFTYPLIQQVCLETYPTYMFSYVQKWL